MLRKEARCAHHPGVSIYAELRQTRFYIHNPMPCTPLPVSKRHGQTADKGQIAAEDLEGQGRGCAKRSAGHTVPMTDPNPQSVEALLRKASWPLVFVGGASFVAAKISESAKEESDLKILGYADDLDAGRLKVRPGLEASIRESAGRIEKSGDTYDENDALMAFGFIALCLGVAFSIYANKLRKARTGE